MSAPSPRQLEVLRVIAQHQARRRYSPSVREICAAMGIASTHGVACHLNALEKKGLITRVASQARTVVLTNEGQTWLGAEAA